MENKQLSEIVVNLNIELKEIFKKYDPNDRFKNWHLSSLRKGFVLGVMWEELYKIYEDIINELKYRLKNKFSTCLSFESIKFDTLFWLIGSTDLRSIITNYFHGRKNWIPQNFFDGINRMISAWDISTKKWKYILNNINSIDKILSGQFEFKSWNPLSVNITYKWLEKDIANWSFRFSINGTQQKIDIQNYSKKKVVFEEIIIEDSKEFNSINLRGIKISKLIIKNLDNTSNFIITDCNLVKLQILDSDLWKMKFNGVEIGKLTIKNTTLNESIFNGVNFKSYTLWKNVEWKNINNKKLKDNYRQLKHVMEKNANYTEANKFYAMEMDEYRSYLKKKKLFKKWWFNKVHKEDYFGELSQNISDYIVLFMSKLISNYWNNWLSVISLMFYLALWAVCIKYTYERGIFDILNGFQPVVFHYYESTHLIDLITKITYIISMTWIGLCIYKIWLFLKQSVIFSILFMLLIGIFIEIFLSIPMISYFLDFINPLYWFRLSTTELAWMDTLSKAWLIIYKTIYTILLYYLLVGLKRTTRR